MKIQIVTIMSMLLLLVVPAMGAEEPMGIFVLNETTFILVQSIDAGLEVMGLRNGKLFIMDSMRYVRNKRLVEATRWSSNERRSHRVSSS